MLSYAEKTSLYHIYLNDYLTVGKFADDHGLTRADAMGIIVQCQEMEPESVKGLEATCIRTLAGDRNAYDVLWRANQKEFKPMIGGIYATIIENGHGIFYSTSDMLRVKPSTEANLNYDRQDLQGYWAKIHSIAAKLDAELLSQAYPGTSRPGHTTLPDAKIIIEV